MTWVRLDDGFTDHPKVTAAGEQAGWLFVAGLCYCNRFLTDGFIPAAQVPRLTAAGNWKARAQKLIEHGLWHPVAGGYQVHDFLEYQPSAADVKREREQTKKRVENWREKHKGNGAAEADVTPLLTPLVTPLVTVPPSRPVPSIVLDDINHSPPTPSEPEPTAPAEPVEREILKQQSARPPRKTKTAPPEPIEFAGFWAAYPKRDGARVGRANALAEFIAKPPGEYPRMVRAAEIYALVCGAEGEHRRPRDAERFLRDDNFWQEMLDIDPASIRATNGVNGHANHQPSAVDKRAASVSSVVELAESLYPAAPGPARLPDGRAGRAEPADRRGEGLVEGSFRSVG